MTQPNPLDYVAIQNTISTYCIALDTKDFALLRKVFTGDVDTIYPFAEMKGVQVVAERIEKRLAAITSQHALTTQTIEVSEDGKTATATTYFTGIHFGKGKWQGQQVTAWGRYDDELVVTDAKASVPGASGHWMICKRSVTFQGRMGEEGVMDGE
ncbi:hypothetical protein AC578_8015 [Pseudocercospora eumusae]|uniref:SnoaL-like domain-containing protein n=1 Tax=Pseudocercospora eumusae TaxID=321146 RepID=A0A139HGQ3_9PEZI|nr:hypothetical protein AC578_8015 [Pseudocercospora eumusae]